MSTRRRPRAERVLIAAMPWARDDVPSIQVATLQAYLRAGGVAADGGHWFADVADTLGVESYRALSSPVLQDAEALYSALVFPEMRAALLRDPRLRAKERRLGGARPGRERVRLPFELSERFLRRFHRLHGRMLERYDWSRYVLVGLTLNFGQTVPSLYVAREIKRRNPACRIIVGGAEASGQLGASLLRHFPEIDYACNGEGEKPLLHLARALLAGAADEGVEAIGGLVSRREDGTIRVNPPDQVRRMTELPIPEFDDYFAGAPRRRTLGVRLPIEASRGCYYACTFCGIGLQWTGVRIQAPERVAATLRVHADRHRILDFEFVDNVNPANAAATFARVAADGRDYRFFFELRTGVSRELLARMRSAGLVTTQMGIEALSRGLLARFNKRARVITNLQGMKNCQALGVRLTGNLIVDHPLATADDVAETLRTIALARGYPPPDDVSYFALEVGAPDFATAAGGSIVIAGNHRAYRRLYPQRLLATLDLTRKAYRLCAGAPVDWAPVVAARRRWARDYARITRELGPGVPPLAYYDGGEFLRVEDHRSGELEVYVLQGIEREIYLAADQVIAWDDLRARLPHVPEASLARELAELVATGLTFAEDDCFLSLAVAGGPTAAARSAPASAADSFPGLAPAATTVAHGRSG